MTTDPFDLAVAIVLEEEGVFSDDRHDPGGATKYGITIATLSKWLKRPATVADVKALTPNVARQIYREAFWDFYRCSEMPWRWGLAVFDCEVNQGGKAIYWAELALNIVADGKVGPVFLASTRAKYAEDALNKFMALRAEAYLKLPNADVYGHGWLKRLFDVHAKGILRAPAA